MADLTDEMKEFLNSNLMGGHHQQRRSGRSRSKMSMFIIDSNHIGYHERTAAKHTVTCLTAAIWSSRSPTSNRRRDTVSAATSCCIPMTPSMTNRSKSPKNAARKKPMTIPVLEITEIQDLTRALRQAKPSSRTDRFHTEPVETTISENRRRDCMGLRFAVIERKIANLAAYRSRRFDHGFLYGSCMHGLWISVDKCSLIHLSTDFLKEVAGEYWFLPCWFARISEDAYATTNNQRR